MTKNEIKDEVYKLLFEQSGELDRGEFRDLLHETIDDCKTMLNAMDEEELNNSEDGS